MPTSTLRISRTSEWANCLRRFGVFLDGNKIGTIRNGQTVDFPVAPGEHELFLTVDWCRTEVLLVDIPEGETLHVHCGSSPFSFGSVFRIWAGAGDYINLWCEQKVP